MTTTVIKKFSELNTTVEKAFYKVIADGASYDECEELYEYICEQRLASLPKLVEMGHMFYDSDPELLDIMYELRAHNLIKKFIKYPDKKTEAAKEAVIKIATKKDLINSVTEFMNETDDKTFVKEVLDIIEFNKYLHKETINVMRSEF